MNAWTVVGYTYRAANFCPEHIVAALTANPGDAGHGAAVVHNIEDHLDVLARLAGIDRHDEDTYDSGDFPKVVFLDQLTGDEFCDAGHALLEA